MKPNVERSSTTSSTPGWASSSSNTSATGGAESRRRGERVPGRLRRRRRRARTPTLPAPRSWMSSAMRGREVLDERDRARPGGARVVGRDVEDPVVDEVQRRRRRAARRRRGRRSAARGAASARATASARARATVRAISTSAMPSAVGDEGGACPTAKFVAAKVPTTTTRKSGSVHASDAIAYDTPKRNIEPSVRLRPPLSSRGVENGQVVAAEHARCRARPRPIPIDDRGPLHVVDERLRRPR